ASAIGARAMGGGGSTGLWGLLAVAALAGPFAHHFWRDRRANLAGALPLLLMVIVLWKVLGGFASAGDSSPFGIDMRSEMQSAVSLGAGFYLSIVVAGYFAFTAYQRWKLT